MKLSGTFHEWGFLWKGRPPIRPSCGQILINPSYWMNGARHGTGNARRFSDSDSSLQCVPTGVGHMGAMYQNRRSDPSNNMQDKTQWYDNGRERGRNWCRGLIPGPFQIPGWFSCSFIFGPGQNIMLYSDFQPVWYKTPSIAGMLHYTWTAWALGEGSCGNVQVAVTYRDLWELCGCSP